jgi:hypothetical protein
MAALIWLLKGTTKISQYSEIYSCSFNCCFTVHFDKYKNILPTDPLYIKNMQSHTAQHPMHTLQTEAHIATAQQQF